MGSSNVREHANTEHAHTERESAECAYANDSILHTVAGPIQTNCYIYVSAGEAMVVDPGGEGESLAEALTDEGIHVALIVATHGHGDHVGGVAALKRVTGAPYLISATDAVLASRVNDDAELGLTYDDNAPAPDRTIGEGDLIEVGSARFRVIETPGHTPGGVVLVGEASAEGVAFVGDTIFAGSVGRTDLAGGNPAALLASLNRLQREIDPACLLLSGHGAQTTMDAELHTNPFLQPGAERYFGL